MNTQVLLLFPSTPYFDFWEKIVDLFLKYLEHFFKMYFKAVDGGLKAHASYIFSMNDQCKISLYFIGLALDSILHEIIWYVIAHRRFPIICNFFTNIFFKLRQNEKQTFRKKLQNN